MVTVSVILPTFNEAANLPVIVPQICKALTHAELTHEVIVVDDDSPDGSWEVAGSLSTQFPVRVIRRELERGLATAVMTGFATSEAEICVVMDADLSHPIEKLVEMIRPILKNECDITVGSRYVAGGDSSDWAWYRKILSRGGGILASALTSLTDPTSGFMAIRRSLLHNVKLEPIGWKIVLEAVVKTKGRVKEIPISFGDRLYGESKLNAKVQFQYLEHLWALHDYRFPSFLELIKFCLVGVSGLVVDTTVLTLSVELLSLDPRWGANVAFLAAVTSNYILDRGWVFGDGGTYGLGNYLKFVGVCLGGFVLRLMVMHLLIQQLDMYYIFASLIGILLGTFFNFFGSKLFVFKPAEVEKR